MSAADEYRRREERWRRESADAARLFDTIGNWRLAIGVAEAIILVLVFGSHRLPVAALAPGLIAFFALVVWHSRIRRRKTLAQRALAYYDRGLARIEDRWPGTGNTGGHFRDATHVYTDDLDVFGKGSLFELVSTARTSPGEDELADWLTHPATGAEAAARQEAVRELAPQVDLREDIALLGEDIKANVDRKTVELWALQPASPFPISLRLLVFVLSVSGVSALVAFFAQRLPIYPVAAIVAINLTIRYFLRARISRVLLTIERPGGGLRLISQLTARLEREHFSSQRLHELHGFLQVHGEPASQRIRRLSGWMDWLESGDHQLIRALRVVLLWQEQFAMAIEGWRSGNGSHVPRWLRAIAEFEALSSLAALAFEHPHWIFPQIVHATAPTFEASALGHPLLPSTRCVTNDVCLGAAVRLLIVSGSNMSGKSTLLRSVGLATVLAFAGGPVPAISLRISALQAAASMRVSDSLQDNKSRFFAEITRVRQIFDLASGPIPVLFLLDELLSGTNSHDRRIGAARIVRNLLETGAIGLITTHDLALADIEKHVAPAAANVHFDDQISDGRIDFDYRLRPGVVTHSNALELMRAIGLNV